MRKSSPVLLFMLSPLITLAVIAAAAAIRRLDADLFAGVWWTFCLLAVFAHPALPTQRTGIIKRAAALFLLPILWILINDPVLQWVQNVLHTHPTARFFLPFYIKRLELSLAILKIIDALWPSDLRSLLTLLLCATMRFGLFPLFRQTAARLPQKWFEITVNSCNEAATGIADYLRSSLAGAFSVLAVVGVGTFALGFLEAGMVTAFNAMCWFLPYGGWIIGPIGSLLFVEQLQSIPQTLALLGLALLLSQLPRVLPRTPLNEVGAVLAATLCIAVAGALASFLGALVVVPAASIGAVTAKSICRILQTETSSISDSN